MSLDFLFMSVFFFFLGGEGFQNYVSFRGLLIMLITSFILKMTAQPFAFQLFGGEKSEGCPDVSWRDVQGMVGDF